MPEVSESASCGPVEEATVRVWYGVVVPIPSDPFDAMRIRSTELAPNCKESFPFAYEMNP